MPHNRLRHWIKACNVLQREAAKGACCSNGTVSDGTQVRESHMMDAQVQWLTMSTANSPMPMERPAVLNCSLL